MAKTAVEDGYPDLPARQQRFTIGEVCALCNIRPHILRYWEGLFSQLGKVERRKNRRYYAPEDIRLIRKINRMRQDGLTTRGIAGILAGHGPTEAVAAQQPVNLPKLRAEIGAIIKLLS